MTAKRWKPTGIALIAALSTVAMAFPLVPVHADPPEWAPAHGRRDHDQGDEGDHGRNDDEGGKQHKHKDHDKDRDHEGDRQRGRNGSGRDSYTSASDQARQDAAHRQGTKNTWRNLGYLSAAAAIYGLLKHDKTITFAGVAGALYSANRYEHDRRSQNASDRARVALFDQGYLDRDGAHYLRHEVTRNGQHYYFFGR